MTRGLIPCGGHIGARLYPSEGPEGSPALLWDVCIEFEGFELDGVAFEAFILCDRIAWPMQDWRQLAGQTLDLSGDDCEPTALFVQPLETDCDPYLAYRTRLEVGQRDGVHFPVIIRLDLDDEGEGLWQGTSFECTLTLPFTGVAVISDEPRERAASADEAVQRLSGLVALETLGAPAPDELGYRLPPKLED